MKSLSVGLAAHIAQEVTTLATCWRIERRDGQVFGFTDHLEALVVDGVTYQAASGYTASAIKSTAGMNVDNLEVSGGLDASAITEADLLAGKWDFAEVRIFQVNYEDLTQGTNKLRRGWLGEVRTADGAFTVELRGMMQLLQQNIGRVVSPACDADLGDARCKVNLGSFSNGTVSGTLTSVTSNRVFVDSSLGQATGWFTGGVVTWTSGPNQGLRMEVREFQSGGQISLVLPMPYTVSIGDGYTMTAGCDKRLSTCRDKFANVINFRGFPHVPGLNRMSSGT